MLQVMELEFVTSIADISTNLTSQQDDEILTIFSNEEYKISELWHIPVRYRAVKQESTFSSAQ